MGFFDNVDDCLRFFSHQRGVAVSQPCQLRYLYYFDAFYRKKIKSPSVKRLRGIQFVKVPSIYAGGCWPYFTVYDCKGVEKEKLFSYTQTKQRTPDQGGVVLDLKAHETNKFVLTGDILIRFKHAGYFSNSEFCRI